MFSILFSSDANLNTNIQRERIATGSLLAIGWVATALIFPLAREFNYSALYAIAPGGFSAFCIFNFLLTLKSRKFRQLLRRKKAPEEQMGPRYKVISWDMGPFSSNNVSSPNGSLLKTLNSSVLKETDIFIFQHIDQNTVLPQLKDNLKGYAIEVGLSEDNKVTAIAWNKISLGKNLSKHLRKILLRPLFFFEILPIL